MRSSAICCVILFLACLSACSVQTEEINPLGLQREQIEPLCLSYTACSNESPAGDDPAWCSLRLNSLMTGTRWDLSRLSQDMPVQVALLMSPDCVIGAMGSCDRVGACADAATLEWNVGEGTRCENEDVMLVLYQGRPDLATGVFIRLDCSALGLKCVEPASGPPLCAIPAADEGETFTTCKGSVATNHGRGYETKVDCGRSGLDCVPGEYVRYANPCTGPGQECEGPYLEACDGTSITWCANGHLVTEDCADEGLTCTIREDGRAFCMPPGCFADRGDVTCNGSEMTFCGLGGSTTVDCVELGFEGCVSDFYSGAGCTEP